MTAEQSAVGRKSRRKGKTFEQQIARMMVDASPRRWRTTRNSGRTDIPGDVYCMDVPCPWMIECKHRMDWSIQSIIKSNVSFEKEYAKVRNDFDNAELEYISGLLIFSKDPLGIWMHSVPGRLVGVWEMKARVIDQKNREWILIGSELSNDQRTRDKILFGR